MLTPNTPLKRIQYVVKTYGERSPGVVLDTFYILSDLVGIERPEELGVAMAAWVHIAIGPPHRPGRTPVQWHNRLTLWSAKPSTPLFATGVFRGSSHALQDFDDMFGTSTQAELMQAALMSIYEIYELDEPAAGDPLWPWVAQQLSRAKKRAMRSGDAWEYMDVLHGLHHKGTALALWQEQENIDLGRYDWRQALEALETFEVDRGPEGVSQGEVIFKWPDGWTVQRLDEEGQLEEEGEIMQHCVGGYCAEVESGEVEIYSLRDPSGNPHVTMEYAPDLKRMLQIQGKQNRDPIPEYRARVDEYLKKTGIKGLISKEETAALNDVGTKLASSIWNQMYSEGTLGDPRKQFNNWSTDTSLAIELYSDAERGVQESMGASVRALYRHDDIWEDIVELVDDGARRGWNDLASNATDLIEEAIRDAKTEASSANSQDEAENMVFSVLSDAGMLYGYIDEREFHRIVADVAQDADWDDDDDEDDDYEYEEEDED